jgi:hypothetical protein
MGDERQGMSENTNETVTEDDDVEAHALGPLNTNETAAEDDVEAHGWDQNTNETAAEDDA